MRNDLGGGDDVEEKI